MKKIILVFVLLIVISGCVSLFMHKKEDKEEAEEILLEAPDEFSRLHVVEGVKVVKMTAKQWEFIPSLIEVELGDDVRLEIESEDVKHGIRIPYFGIEEEIIPGETTVIEFKVRAKGEFEFKSSIYSGVGFQDMEGKIIVK